LVVAAAHKIVAHQGEAAVVVATTQATRAAQEQQDKEITEVLSSTWVVAAVAAAQARPGGPEILVWLALVAPAQTHQSVDRVFVTRAAAAAARTLAILGVRPLVAGEPALRALPAAHQELQTPAVVVVVDSMVGLAEMVALAS
jgi:hypothetical protein